jgi:hypothetical protein
MRAGGIDTLVSNGELEAISPFWRSHKLLISQ